MTNPEAGAAMFRALRALGRINARIEAVLAYVSGLCLGTFTLVVLVDVIYRQMLAHPLMWPSEWAVMTFVWSVLLGASVAARRRAHFVVEVLPALPAALDYALRVLVALLTLVFALVLLYFGLGMTLSGMRRFTPMMGYPMVWVFAAFPLAGVAFTLFGIEHLLEVVGGRDRREQPEA